MAVFFSSEFQKQLDKQILDFENRSSAELVVVIRSSSGRYRDANLYWGFLFSWLALLLFFFLPTVFGNYLILSGTLLAFVLGLGLSRFIPEIKRLFTTVKRRTRQVKILAAAIFHKAGIHKTGQRIGMLLYVSTFEKKAVLLTDVGIDAHINVEELKVMKNKFATIFHQKDAATELLKTIKESSATFEAALPILLDDEPELPNTIHLDADFNI